MPNIDYGLYAMTLFGSAAMYVFSLHQGFEGAVSFLKRMFPTRSAVFYDRVDFILVTIMGSVLGYILFDPKVAYQAITAGLGWVSAVNVVMNKIKKSGK
jgi:uncharacterized membrane protein YbjE (DUF340 family)